MEDVVLAWLQLVFILQRCSVRSLSLVDCCPSRRNTWDERERSVLCDSSEVYHSMQTTDKKHSEFCARKTIVSLAKCPVKKEGRQIDNHVDCKQESVAYPQEEDIFISDELYRYPGCFSPCQAMENESRETSNPDNCTKTTFENEKFLSSSNAPPSSNTMMAAEKDAITDLSSGHSPDLTSEILMVTDVSAEYSNITSDMLMLIVIRSQILIEGVGGLLIVFMLATCTFVWKMRRDMTVRSGGESGTMNSQSSISDDKLERGILPTPDTMATQNNPADTVYDYAYEDCRILPPASVPNNGTSSVGDITDIQGLPYTYEAPVIKHLYESLETLQMSEGYQKERIPSQHETGNSILSSQGRFL